MHTPGEWHTACTGNHQGLICSYTGENIAVAYDKKDAPILAAAPDLLEACQAVDRAHVGDGIDMAKAVDLCLLAIAKATD